MADHAAAEQVNINYSLVIKREHIIIEREAAAFRNLGEKFSTTAQYRVKKIVYQPNQKSLDACNKSVFSIYGLIF